MDSFYSINHHYVVLHRQVICQRSLV